VRASKGTRAGSGIETGPGREDLKRSLRSHRLACILPGLTGDECQQRARNLRGAN
jgi:hypothetical protein